MYTFTVPGMTCGHCTSTIGRHVKNFDAKAELDFDLSNRKVSVVSAAGEARVKAAIEEAGFEVANDKKTGTVGGCCRMRNTN